MLLCQGRSAQCPRALRASPCLPWPKNRRGKELGSRTSGPAGKPPSRTFSIWFSLMSARHAFCHRMNSSQRRRFIYEGAGGGEGWPGACLIIEAGGDEIRVVGHVLISHKSSEDFSCLARLASG